MKIGIIGCGYVCDFYLESLLEHPNLELVGVADHKVDRANIVAAHYGTKAYPSMEALLVDPQVQLIVNLTDPKSHYPVNKAALVAGKHVYSEKPFAVDVAEGEELIQLAKEKKLLISGAPCSVLSETAQTLFRAVRDGAVGHVRLVYAELDDNPIHLMRPEGWRSPTGAPWPYRSEYETGCTLEHAGYYLTWLAAMFGPATEVTAFSSCLVPNKSPSLAPIEAPDFSVAVITFQSGVVARLTCSIIAPLDHRLRIIGDEGVLTTNECWNYNAPVYLERFSQLSLNARKSVSVRTNSALQKLFGIGGSKLSIHVRTGAAAKALRDVRCGRRSPLGAVVKMIKSRELYAQDYCRGVASMAEAIEGGGSPLSPEFLLHITELALAIHAAGQTGAAYVPSTSFAPFSPLPMPAGRRRGFRESRPGLATMMTERLIARLHKH